MAPRSVTIVGPTHPYKGGISQHTTSLAAHLAEVVERVDLLSWSAQYPRLIYPGQLELSDATSEERFPLTRRSLAWYDPTSWWRGAGPPTSSDLVVLSVVNAFQVPSYVTIAARARRAGARVIALCHNVVPHDAGPVQRRLVGGLLRYADGVLVHNPDERRRAEGLGIERVTEAALPFHFPAAPRDVGLRDPVGRVVVFGYIRPYKGVDVLIDAVAHTGRRVSATVAGEFWMSEDQLRQRARLAGVDDRIRFAPGYLTPDEVLDLLIDHDALVLPYISGTGSQQPRIASLVRRPCVVSAVAGLADQVEDGVNGLVVPPGDAEALARALDAVCEPSLYRSLCAEISPPDVEAEWSTYVSKLLAA